jgi:hypothetical protein
MPLTRLSQRGEIRKLRLMQFRWGGGLMADTTPERMTADTLDAIRIDVDRNFAQWGGPAEIERRFKFLLALVDQQAEDLHYANGVADLAMKHRDEAEARVDTITAQLPEGMKDCTIQFKECSLGHGRLTATNWGQHDCPMCCIQSLERELAEAKARVKTARADALEEAAKVCDHIAIHAERRAANHNNQPAITAALDKMEAAQACAISIRERALTTPPAGKIARSGP